MPPRRRVTKPATPKKTRVVTADAAARTTQKRDERRAEIVTAAREIFAEKGYHDATIDDITRRAGVAKGTFYLYFTEKKELYYELVRTFFAHITDIGVSIRTEVTTREQFFDRYQLAIERLLQVFADHAQLARLTYRESASLDPTLEQMVHDFYRQIALVEVENIQLGVRLGIFRQVDPLVAAYAHIGMVERTALGLLREPNPPPKQHLVLQLMSLAYEGIRAPKEPAG